MPPSSDSPHQVLRRLPALSLCVVAVVDIQKLIQLTIWGNVLEVRCQTKTFFIFSNTMSVIIIIIIIATTIYSVCTICKTCCAFCLEQSSK